MREQRPEEVNYLLKVPQVTVSTTCVLSHCMGLVALMVHSRRRNVPCKKQMQRPHPKAVR